MKSTIKIRPVEGVHEVFIEQLGVHIEIPCITGIQQCLKDDFGKWGDWHDIPTLKHRAEPKEHHDEVCGVDD